MFMSSFIKLFIFLLILLSWTIVGLLFWIPRLFLAISQFSTLIVFMAMSVSDTNESDLNSILKNAIEFYPNGFVLVYNTFFNVNDEENCQRKKRSASIIDWSKVLVRSIYTVFFWLISLYFALKIYKA